MAAATEEEEGDKKEPETLHKEESPEHVVESPEQDDGMCFRMVSYAFECSFNIEYHV